MVLQFISTGRILSQRAVKSNCLTMTFFAISSSHLCMYIDTTVVPTKSDSEVMFCLQSYQGPIMDRSLVF